MILECEIELVFKKSLNMSTYHHTLYRDDRLGIQAEKITNKTDGGYGLGKSKTYYYIDNDEREFHTIDELIEAYNQKYKDSEDTPDMEVKYIKVLISRKIK